MAENLPFGWSRETTIRIDRDGHFWHEGQKFEHDGLAKAFASWLDVDPESGRYILRNSIHWVFVAADDAPLVVTEARPDGDGLVLALTDGTSEPLAPETLRIDGDDVPYADVRAGKLPARFSRRAAFVLGEWLLGNPEIVPRRVPRGEGAARSAA
jgi:hypothetical protein